MNQEIPSTPEISPAPQVQPPPEVSAPPPDISSLENPVPEPSISSETPLEKGGEIKEASLSEENVNTSKEIEQAYQDLGKSYGEREVEEKDNKSGASPPPVEERYREERIGKPVKEERSKEDKERKEEFRREFETDNPYKVLGVSESASPYEILGIEENASPDEIEKAFREKASQYHPDRYLNPEDKKVATEVFKIIGNAYEKLTKGKREEGISFGRKKERGFRQYERPHFEEKKWKLLYLKGKKEFLCKRERK